MNRFPASPGRIPDSQRPANTRTPLCKWNRPSLRHGYGNPARMDREHFLVPAKQLHGLEIRLELEFCSRIEAERAAERRPEPFFGLRHHIYGEYCRMCAGFLFPLLRLIRTVCALVWAL